LNKIRDKKLNRDYNKKTIISLQTNRQTDKQTNRQTDKQTNKETTDIEIEQ